MELEPQIQNSQEPQEAGWVNKGATGAALRAARVELDLSIDDVSGRIKFAHRQIEALELDDYANLPEGAFLRGFVRSYARMLQLDEKKLIAALPSEMAATDPVALSDTVDVPFPSEFEMRKANLLKIAAVVAGTLIVLGVWRYTATPADPASSAADPMQSAASAPVAASATEGADALAMSQPAEAAPAVVENTAAIVAAPAAQSAVVATEAPLRLVFVESSWAEVRDKHGTMLISQRNPAGSELSFEGEAPFYVAIARAGGVKLYFKGKLVDLTPNTANGSARLKLE